MTTHKKKNNVRTTQIQTNVEDGRVEECSKASGSSVVDSFRDKFCNCVSHKI